MHSCFALVFVLAIGLVFGARDASAQQPPIEPLEPDRPDVTNGTRVVDSGMVQIEFGGIYTHAGPSQHAFGSPLTTRVGVLDWLEVRFGTDGLVAQHDDVIAATGFGNVQVGAKLRLWNEPGGAPVLSILPNVNVPTADSDKGLGSGDPDYTVAFLTGTDLGRRSHVDLNYGIGAIGAGSGRRHFAQHLASASYSFTASEHWSPYFETFWFSRQDVDGHAVTALDGGALYVVNPRLVVDGGVQAGVTPDAPALAVFGGVSLMLGDRGVGQRQRGHGHVKHKTPARHA